MSDKHGDFVWYELLTNNIEGARSFYGRVIGWQVEDSLLPDMDYRYFGMPADEPGLYVGGMMQLTNDMVASGASPVWLGYIHVNDVDVRLKAITATGGQIQMPPTDIPDVGRIAMVTDPQGVPFYVMHGISEEASLAFAYDKPRLGHCAWNELRTSDQNAAFAFYSEQFHWSKDGEMDMGPMGSYDFLRHGGVIGAMMTNPEKGAPPRWNYYFRVADIDEAVQAIQNNGGQVTEGPDEIPGGDFTINGIDPQGARFALVGGRS
ncbi:VOC family protein [Aestuariicella sp. G3-2]|uniref:VOC family protein n=1 Tax=Pseudomaricurvus albidus TaxID=2842452 RepID=UPI001C0AC4D0|nr:VOC family protein [Aestuariicella albida]MBU3068242.1 VOC family protein [Aestuariicella albida]